MKRILNIWLIGLLCMSVAWILHSCTDDDGGTQPNMRELHVSLGSQRYEDVTPLMTRATLPDGYAEYVYASATLPITQIQGYMASMTENGPADVPCIFSHKASNDPTPIHTWMTRVPLDGEQQYYFYGFTPKEFVTTHVEIAPYDDDPNDEEAANYAKGAVMTFHDLNAVTPDDICIVVGVQGYDVTAPTDMTLRLGQFGYKVSEGTNLYLLTDHLYASMEFQMKVNEDYDKLRTIKLKSLQLLDQVTAMVNATVTLQSNVTGASPISVAFLRTPGTNGKPAVLYEGDGLDLTTSPHTFMACLCPGATQDYVLEAVYDVYDKKDNLVRENQKAQNTITLKSALTSGTQRIIRVEVNPTFLYVLSEDDVDNPEPGENWVWGS